MVVLVATISTTAHDSSDGGAAWLAGAVGVGLVVLWARLLVLSADAPIDLRHAVAVSRVTGVRSAPGQNP